MHKRSLPLVALAVASLPAAQTFADPILPVGEVAAVSNRPAGALGDQLGSGWAMRCAFGVGRGPLWLAAPLEIGAFDPIRPERDSAHLMSLGIGLELGGTLWQGEHAGLRARAGYQWRWLSGDGEVRRTCDQVGSCDGGYWHEEPSYLLSGPSAGLAATWSWPLSDSRVGFALDGRIERAHVDLPGEGTVAGPLLAIGIAVWIAPAVRH